MSKHEVWTKVLPDGSVLRTSISKGRGEYGAGLFSGSSSSSCESPRPSSGGQSTGVSVLSATGGEPASTAATVPLKALLRLRAMGYSDA